MISERRPPLLDSELPVESVSIFSSLPRRLDFLAVGLESPEDEPPSPDFFFRGSPVGGVIFFTPLLFKASCTIPSSMVS